MAGPDAKTFAYSLRAKFGARALEVAEHQRDSADGVTRRSWDAIVTALKKAFDPPLS